MDEQNQERTISGEQYQNQVEVNAMRDYFKAGSQKTFYQLVIENYILREQNAMYQAKLMELPNA